MFADIEGSPSAGRHFKPSTSKRLTGVRWSHAGHCRGEESVSIHQAFDRQNYPLSVRRLCTQPTYKERPSVVLSCWKGTELLLIALIFVLNLQAALDLRVFR